MIVGPVMMLVQAPSSSSATSVNSDFDDAVRDFQGEFRDQELFDFTALHTGDDLYSEIQKTQEEQGRNKQLRNMKKIQPLLDCLEQYSSVLEVFVQVKPSVLALIWVGTPVVTIFHETYT